MNHQDILNEIGNSLGIELTFDEHQQCFVLLDEHLMMSLRSVDDAWILYGMLGRLGEDGQPKDIASSLLTLNLHLAESGGASIAREASSNVLMLVLRVATADMDGARMQAALGDFVDALDSTLTAVNALLKPQAEQPSLAAFSKGPSIFDRA
ncbi:MAG: chaperone SicP [Comamonas sp.]